MKIWKFDMTIWRPTRSFQALFLFHFFQRWHETSVTQSSHQQTPSSHLCTVPEVLIGLDKQNLDCPVYGFYSRYYCIFRICKGSCYRIGPRFLRQGSIQSQLVSISIKIIPEPRKHLRKVVVIRTITTVSIYWMCQAHSVLLVLTPLIFPTTQWGRNYYHAFLTKEERD